MAKRMLIDATHPEETRVVVVSGKRLEEFDFETTSKKQLKGNIYLAKVTRVEPSLQAAFVDYGGNRHGFLAFSEIHPDYYRIPVADREALLAEEAAFDDAEDAAERTPGGMDRIGGETADEAPDPGTAEPYPADNDSADNDPADGSMEQRRPDWTAEAGEAPDNDGRSLAARASDDRIAAAPEDLTASWPGESGDELMELPANGDADRVQPEGAATGSLETVGGDEMEDVVEPRRTRNTRRYKIQEVIKRRQIMLVQVTKEERGNKGAALTTYLSLAGRYCVLMPNTARGGGVSRKITNAGDRKRLKSIIEEMEIPEGMAVIVRTAGSERNKTEIRRDYDYLLRLWDEIRELTLKSTAPALIYEEANLIKRSIRDLYSRDIEDILVEGEDGYKAAKAFMRTLTPSHAKRVQLYKDPTSPLFHRFQVESQLDAIHNPVVQLKSGGYIVINPTEALVAIDVNSGRSTRERNIEETALRTNLEAAEEIARQLRLRDLAGLIVIDFIDMEEQRHNNQVERRLKESMRNDRARIQLGHISPFGLLELSRQRLRPSLVEASTETCPRCRGIGYIRSTESTALHVLRSIEEEGIRNRSAAITVQVPTAVALYVLNQKRKALAEIEMRHNLRIYLEGDDTLVPPDFRIERMKALAPEDDVLHPMSPVTAPLIEEEPEEDEVEETAAEGPETTESAERRGGGRRRSRRRRRRDDTRTGTEAELSPESGDAGQRGLAEAGPEEGVPAEAGAEAVAQTDEEEDSADESDEASAASEENRRRRRRGRRGGRRRSRRTEDGVEAGAELDAEAAGDESESPSEPSPAPSDEARPEAGPAPDWPAPDWQGEATPGWAASSEDPTDGAVEGEAPQPDMGSEAAWEPASWEPRDEGGPTTEPATMTDPSADPAAHAEEAEEAAAAAAEEAHRSHSADLPEEQPRPEAEAHDQEPAEHRQEAAEPEPSAAEMATGVTYLPVPSERDSVTNGTRENAPQPQAGEPQAEHPQQAEQSTQDTSGERRRRGWWRRHAE